MERVTIPGESGDLEEAYIVTVDGRQYLTWECDFCWGLHEIDAPGQPSYERWAMLITARDALGKHERQRPRLGGPAARAVGGRGGGKRRAVERLAARAVDRPAEAVPCRMGS